MFDIVFMKASTWFEDERERGYVAVGADYVIEFNLTKPRRPRIEYDFDHGFYIMVDGGLFNIGITDKG